MINHQTVHLENILQDVLKKDYLAHINNVKQNLYLNELTATIMTEEEIKLDARKSYGYLIQLNTTILKELLEIYENKSSKSNYLFQTGQYIIDTITFNDKEDVSSLLERLLSVVTEQSFFTSEYKIKLSVDPYLLNMFSIRAIFDLTNPNLVVEKYQNDKERLNIFWYQLLDKLTENMQTYKDYLMNYLIQHDNLFNVNALKNKNFCTLLLSFQFKSLLSPFELDPKEKLLQKITMMVVQYNNPKLLQYILTNENNMNKMKKIAELTSFSNFDDRAWYYNIILNYQKNI